MRFAWFLAVVSAVGCANAVGSSNGAPGPEQQTPTDPSQTNPTGPDPDESTPHALGTIVLGESRSAANPAQSTPVISASFVADAKKGQPASCGRTVGKCEITEAPQCTTGGVTGCASGEVCTYDDKCNAKCVATCTASCAADEECYLSSPGVPECRPKATFDAGALAFDGTTQSITLFPPYTVQPTGIGAPFLAKSEIRVQASGATGTGFDKFDEKFTSTTFMLTTPPLAKTPKNVVFGTGDIPISWQPGADKVTISITGAMATARCDADDASGKFSVPREVVQQVSGTTSTTQTAISVTVSRQRREVRKNKSTLGTINGKPVDKGWLELVTISSESATFQPPPTCTSTTTLCDDRCVYLQSDAQNCGQCGRKCAANQYCSSGVCR
jgi:hypothetical protein